MTHGPDQSLHWRDRGARWLGPFHFLGVFWYRAQRFAARWLPHPIKYVATALTVTFFHTCLAFGPSRALARNQAVVLGRTGWLGAWWRSWRVLWNWAWCRSERYELLGERRRRMSFTVEGIEHWLAATSGARGALLLTAHVGNFEAGHLIPSEMLTKPLHLARAPEPDPAAQAYVDRLLKSTLGPNVVTHLFDDDFRIGLVLMAALRAGDLVAMTCDRPWGDTRTVDVSLFGKPFALPQGPAALARAADVPMIATFFLRLGPMRYRLVFREPIEVARDGDRSQALTAATRRIAQDVEWAIRQAPDQWFCFRDVWPQTTTDGAPLGSASQQG